MSEVKRSRLLNFLSKPRYKGEIAECLDLPIGLVNLHLAEAIESGQILVSERIVTKTFLNSKGKPKKLEGFLYVSRNSPLLLDNIIELPAQEVEENSKSDRNVIQHVISLKFLPRKQNPAMNRLQNSKKRTSLKVSKNAHLRVEKGLVSGFLNRFISKKRLTRLDLQDQRSGRKANFARKRKSLSYTGKLHLFQVLSEQPLSFLDIHGLFGLSKRTVIGLVEKGLIEEKWGPRDIGVKFRLTEKGKRFLKELEEAVRSEPTQWRNVFIRMKHKIFP